LGFGIGDRSRRIVVSVNDRVQVIDITDGALVAEFQLSDFGGPVAVENGFDCQGQCQAFILGPSKVHIVDISDLDPIGGVRSTPDLSAPVGQFLDLQIAPGPSGTTRLYITERTNEPCGTGGVGVELAVRQVVVDPAVGTVNEFGGEVAGCVDPGTNAAGSTWNADRTSLFVAVPDTSQGKVVRYVPDGNGILVPISETQVRVNPVDVAGVTCLSGGMQSERIVVASNGDSSTPPGLGTFDAFYPPPEALPTHDLIADPGESIEIRRISGHHRPAQGLLPCDQENSPLVFLTDRGTNRLRIARISDGQQQASTSVSSFEQGVRIERQPEALFTQREFPQPPPYPACPVAQECTTGSGCVTGKCEPTGVPVETRMPFCEMNDGSILSCPGDEVVVIVERACSQCPCCSAKGGGCFCPLDCGTEVQVTCQSPAFPY
jgi:hypothetical protein